MIYAPVLGRPFVELDNHLDLTDFDNFSKQVMFAVAKSRNMFGIGISGPSTPGVITWLPEDDYLEAGDAREKAIDYFAKTSTPQWEVDEWAKLRHDEQLFVSMLMFPAKSLCSALALRKLKNGAGNSGRFHLKHLEAETEDTPARAHFEFVMDWIKKQNVFDEIGRVQFFINTDGHGTPIHRDYADKSHADQFIWIKFFDNKKFFVYDREENVKHIIHSKTAIFDNHQWHGGEPGSGLGVSLRVDGKFNSKFLDKTGLVDYIRK
jgi:hypothetical protein